MAWIEETFVVRWYEALGAEDNVVGSGLPNKRVARLNGRRRDIDGSASDQNLYAGQPLQPCE